MKETRVPEKALFKHVFVADMHLYDPWETKNGFFFIK